MRIAMRSSALGAGVGSGAGSLQVESIALPIFLFGRMILSEKSADFSGSRSSRQARHDCGKRRLTSLGPPPISRPPAGASIGRRYLVSLTRTAGWTGMRADEAGSVFRRNGNWLVSDNARIIEQIARTPPLIGAGRVAGRVDSPVDAPSAERGVGKIPEELADFSDMIMRSNLVKERARLIRPEAIAPCSMIPKNWQTFRTRSCDITKRRRARSIQGEAIAL